MADLVENVLREAAEKESKYKTNEVYKDIDLDIDEGNLLTSDSNPVDCKKLRSSKEEYLAALARDNTQLLVNKIWQLPTTRVDDVVVVQLPDPKTQVPREKPVPKLKKSTKWEDYARMKGIQNKKKSRMMWDEKSQSYKPRWGYNRAEDNTKDWLIEVPQNVDPNEDMFAKRKQAKKDRVDKNELQRLRNIARSQSKSNKVPGVGLTPTETPSKDYLGKALAVAKKSTASIGKFTDALPKEKPSKYTGKKRKFEENYGDMKKETAKQLEILNDLGNKPIVDATRAANIHNNQWETERSKRRREDPNLGKKKAAGKRSNQGKKGSFGKIKTQGGGKSKMHSGGGRGRGGSGGGRGREGSSMGGRGGSMGGRGGSMGGRGGGMGGRGGSRGGGGGRGRGGGGRGRGRGR